MPKFVYLLSSSALFMLFTFRISAEIVAYLAPWIGPSLLFGLLVFIASPFVFARLIRCAIRRVCTGTASIRALQIADWLLAGLLYKSAFLQGSWILLGTALASDPCMNKGLEMSLCLHHQYGFGEAYIVWDPSDETFKPFLERSKAWTGKIEKVVPVLASIGYQDVRKVRDHEFLVMLSYP
ncbi:MAG: hypothetical protein JWM36_275 [Hyphomicrobiales bacterium]|nr:hypothetical protein [Hyphomicrobiales bacterium]